MSYTCCETGELIEDLTRASGITRAGGHDQIIGIEARVVISRSAVLAVPRSLRCNGEPCIGEQGVNIHRIVPEGAIAWIDDFVFSLSEATARRYLPHACATLYGTRAAVA